MPLRLREFQEKALQVLSLFAGSVVMEKMPANLAGLEIITTPYFSRLKQALASFKKRTKKLAAFIRRGFFTITNRGDSSL